MRIDEKLQFILRFGQLGQKEFLKVDFRRIFARIKPIKTEVMKNLVNTPTAESMKSNYFSNFKDCKRIQWSNHRNYGY